MTLNAELRADLLRRVERDQVARRKTIEQARQAAQAGQPAGAGSDIALVDGENLPWFRAVVAKGGWPGRSAVGEDGANAAWLLAQHADRDPAFQRQCLDLLTVAADEGEATKSQVAYLTDRVLLAEGKLQEFGTQTTAQDGQWAPRRLRDAENVDQLRAAMSLGPLAEYLADIAAHYGPPPPPSPVIFPGPKCGGSVQFWPPHSPGKRSANCSNCGLSPEIDAMS